MNHVSLALMIPIVALCIPIVAIVMSMATGMLSKWMDHKQEMARIRSMSGSHMDQAAQSSFDELRNEIAQLRDTTTKYDISVERALDEIRHRLTTVESRTGVAYRQATQEPEQQIVGSPNIRG